MYTLFQKVDGLCIPALRFPDEGVIGYAGQRGGMLLAQHPL